MALRIRVERTEVPRATSRRRGLTLAAATVVAGVLLSGVSYAWWTATGAGTATVASVTAQGLTIAPTTPAVVDLYPGKIDPLTFTVSNNNTYPVTITSVSVVSLASSDETACPSSMAAGNISLANGPYTVSIIVPGKSSATGSIPNFITMNGSAGNGCQTKTFTVTLSATGTSS